MMPRLTYRFVRPQILARFTHEDMPWIVVNFLDGSEPVSMPDLPYAWKTHGYQVRA